MEKTINELKTTFQTGYKPTQSDYENIFDSFRQVSDTNGLATANELAAYNNSLQGAIYNANLAREEVAELNQKVTDAANANAWKEVSGTYEYMSNNQFKLHTTTDASYLIGCGLMINGEISNIVESAEENIGYTLLNTKGIALPWDIDFQSMYYNNGSNKVVYSIDLKDGCFDAVTTDLLSDLEINLINYFHKLKIVYAAIRCRGVGGNTAYWNASVERTEPHTLMYSAKEIVYGVSDCENDLEFTEWEFGKTIKLAIPTAMGAGSGGLGGSFEIIGFFK